MSVVYVVEYNYGSADEPKWKPLCYLGKNGPGYNSRMCCGDSDSAEKLVESGVGPSEKWRVAEYVISPVPNKKELMERIRKDIELSNSFSNLEVYK